VHHFIQLQLQQVQVEVNPNQYQCLCCLVTTLDQTSGKRNESKRVSSAPSVEGANGKSNSSA